MGVETIETRSSETYSKAAALFQRGDYEGAAQLLSEALLHEQSPAVWNDWATAKFLSGHGVEAEGGYRRALDIEPGNVQATANLGALLAAQKRYSEALPVLETALESAAGGTEKERLRELLRSCEDEAVRSRERDGSGTADLWKILARGLSLQTVTLDRVLLRLVNLEGHLHQYTSRPKVGAPDLATRSASSDRQRFAAYLGDHLALTRVLDHFKMYVDTRDISLTPHLLMDGNWEMWITNVFRRLVRPGMTVVDVGANVGYYTLLAAAGTGFTGSVHAVEADPHTFEILEKNVDVNGYGPIVRPHHYAAADKKGEVTLYQYRHYHGSNNIFTDASDRRVAARVQVPAIPLDDLISEPVDVMKIDAEGSEPLIFEGMRELMRRSPAIQIIMEFAPQMIERTIPPVEFLGRIRSAGLCCRVVTHESSVEEWPDEKLLTPGIHTLFLSRA